MTLLGQQGTILFWLILTALLVGAIGWRWLTGTTRTGDGSWLQDHATKHANRVLGEMRTPWERLPLGRTGTIVLIVVGVGAMIVQAVDGRRHPKPTNSAANETAPANTSIDSNSTGAF